MKPRGLTVVVCILCGLGRLSHAAGQADNAAASQQADVPPLSAQGETMPPSAASTVPPPSAAEPAAPAAALEPSTPPPATTPFAPLLRPLPITGGPVQPGHDSERAPARVLPKYKAGLVLRLSLGVEATFIRFGGESSLRRPTFASLDIGVGATERLVVFARASSWLPYEPFASQFFGAGLSYLFSDEGMFLTGAVGVAMRAETDHKFSDRMQGLAAQLDLGQQWPLSSVFTFAVGAHFELATPWLGIYEGTNFGMGLFVSTAYR